VRTLIAEVAPVPRDLAANASRLEQALADHPNVELAVFPELFLSGYELPGAPELSLSENDPPVNNLRAAAARHQTALIVGLIERTGEGALTNAAVCIDGDGGLAGTYRKTHLFGDAEQHAFLAGDELVVVRLAGQLVAPLICFDIEFPEPARLLARAGAELLVTIAANMYPYGPDHQLATRARALDNRRPHVYVNQVGSHRGLRFVGGSAAIDAGGRVLAGAGSEERLLEVDVPIEDEPTEPGLDKEAIKPLMSIRCAGAERRMLRIGIRLCSPARILASPLNSAKSSSTSCLRWGR
jgi:predicted amidohydrolase